MQTDLITKVYFNEHLTHSCVGMPQGLQALLSSFLWRSGKPDQIKRNVMISTKSQGGMLVPDISLKSKSLKAAWVQSVKTRG